MAKNPKSTEDLLERARDRFKQAEESESELRKIALDDARFIEGDQWEKDVKNDRQTQPGGGNRPCLTINRLPQFVNQDAPLTSQLWLLAVTFVTIVALIDSSYAILAGTARAWITDKRVALADSVTGVLLICGGLWLAAARRA